MQAPILIIAFNRPWALNLVLSSLTQMDLKHLYVSIDGPRSIKDEYNIKKNVQIINLYRKDGLDIKYRVNKQNLGLRYAIPSAVDWVLKSHEEVIIIEDDAIPDKSAYKFFNEALLKYAEDPSIVNISAYSCIPRNIVGSFPARLSRYPDSYAWATWRNKWEIYEDKLPDFRSFKDMKIIWKNSFGLLDFLSWRRELKNAEMELINTWAYRWLFSTWKHQKKSINSNNNLILYVGQKEGSNVRTKQKWKEQPIESYNGEKLMYSSDYSKSDGWMSKNVYRNSVRRFVEIYLITIYLIIQKMT